jgi:hypothetical protein
VEDHAKPSNDKDSIPGHLRSKAWERNSSGGVFTASLTPRSSAAFGIQYPQYSQYHFSISTAKPTTSIYTENIEKDFSIPNTALQARSSNQF